MRWPKFTVYDFFFILAYVVLIYYLVANWDLFHCENPLHLWLLVDYNVLLIVRILFVMKFSGYKHTAVKVINVFFYVFAMPGVIAWSVLGVLWQAGDAFECIPEDMVPWSFLLWLGITILTGLTMIICLVYDLVELRRLNKYMQKIEENSASNTKSLIGRTN